MTVSQHLRDPASRNSHAHRRFPNTLHLLPACSCSHSTSIFTPTRLSALVSTPPPPSLVPVVCTRFHGDDVVDTQDGNGGLDREAQRPARGAHEDAVREGDLLDRLVLDALGARLVQVAHDVHGVDDGEDRVEAAPVLRAAAAALELLEERAHAQRMM